MTKNFDLLSLDERFDDGFFNFLDNLVNFNSVKSVVDYSSFFACFFEKSFFFLFSLCFSCGFCF